MKIDASRYRLFMTNPEEFRIKYLWNIAADSGKGQAGLITFGRRRGSAFHDLLDGVRDPILLSSKYGKDAYARALLLFDADQAYSARLLDEVVWREKEFCKNLPHLQGECCIHQLVGRIDTRMHRFDEDFILDYKTTKQRTKSDMQNYRNALAQSPQVDFYMLASGLRKFVFRILWAETKKVDGVPTKVARVSELEVTRAEWELKAFQRSVSMICDTIEIWVSRYGIEQPWPRAIALAVAPENYQFAPIYQRAIYEGMRESMDGFHERVEHLSLNIEDDGEDETDAV